jgi:hypothetical protein
VNKIESQGAFPIKKKAALIAGGAIGGAIIGATVSSRERREKVVDTAKKAGSATIDAAKPGIERIKSRISHQEQDINSYAK